MDIQQIKEAQNEKKFSRDIFENILKDYCILSENVKNAR